MRFAIGIAAAVVLAMIGLLVYGFTLKPETRMIVQEAASGAAE